MAAPAHVATLLGPELSRLSAQELLDRRGDPCRTCGEYDCQHPSCDRDCGRHVFSLVPVGDREFAFCKHCQRIRGCASCGKELPRYLLVYTDNHEGGGELFCQGCCGQDPLEALS